MKAYLVSSNPHKLDEISMLLPEGFELDIITSIAPEREIVEDAKTFYGNSLIKIEAYRSCGVPLLADDSGLVIDALDGFPGIASARFMEGSPYSDKMRELLIRLEGIRESERTARFVCAALFYNPCDNSIIGVEGKVEGTIAFEISGKEGFGYDPIFIPLGYDRTFGELGYSVKSRLSHRARAFTHLLSLVSLCSVRG